MCSSCSASPTTRPSVGSTAGPPPAPPVAIFAKEPSAALVARAVATGTAVVAVDPRARWERLYRLVDHVLEHHGDRAELRLRHRLVRAGAVTGRPDSRHGQHRRRAVPRAGLFGVQRRGRRIAAAVDPGSRRSARASDVDRPMGHLRRAAGRRRRGPRRRATGVRAATTAGRRHPSARRRRPARTGFHRLHLGAAGLATAGRRRRGGAARSRGAGGPHHVPADGQTVDPCAARAAVAGSVRPRTARSWTRSRESWGRRRR